MRCGANTLIQIMEGLDSFSTSVFWLSIGSLSCTWDTEEEVD